MLCWPSVNLRIMKKNVFCTTLLLLAMFIPGTSQTGVWRKIRPVESTIKNVERILGPAREKDYFVRYEISEGVYYVSFSDGRCTTQWKEEWNSKLGGLEPLKEGTELLDWNLPEWTVERIDYTPNEVLAVSSLGLDLRKLKKVSKSPDTPGIFDYVDERRGISYEVQKEYERTGRSKRKVALVTGISLFPAARYRNLRCKTEE